MNRYNISIKILLINKEYDLFIPNNITVGNFLYMILSALKEKELLNLENPMLINSSNGDIIKNEDYIFDTTIENGSKLVLL